jgi:hypothetical protein
MSNALRRTSLANRRTPSQQHPMQGAINQPNIPEWMECLKGIEGAIEGES